MILKTQVLFNDELAEKEYRESEFVWGDYYQDLREVIGFNPYSKDNQELREYTEITLRNGGGRILNIPFDKFKEFMLQVWGNVVIVDHNTGHENNIHQLLSGLGL